MLGPQVRFCHEPKILINLILDTQGREELTERLATVPLKEVGDLAAWGIQTETKAGQIKMCRLACLQVQFVTSEIKVK